MGMGLLEWIDVENVRLWHDNATEMVCWKNEKLNSNYFLSMVSGDTSIERMLWLLWLIFIGMQSAMEVFF